MQSSFTILAAQLTKLRIIFFFLLVLSLSACSAEYGHRVIGDNLTVYFTDSKDQKLAENVALFWKENDLIASKKQDLQLVKKEDSYELRIIAVEPKEVDDMPFDERKLLLDLQREIQVSLFDEPVELVICNSQFEPVYNINE